MNTKSPPSSAKELARADWDPAGASTDPEDSRAHIAALEAKLEYFKQNPHRPRRNLYLLLTMPIVAAFLAVMAFPQAFWHAIAFGVMPAAFYYFSIQEFEKQLALIALAKEEGWHFAPKDDKRKWQLLRDTFPEIFKLGDQGQHVSDQFWGTFQDNPFWMAHFTYTESSGDSSTTYNTSTYAFKLNERVPADFALIPRYPLVSWRFGRALTTEWNDFNKEFTISYKDKKGITDDRDIIGTLNPIVQEKLMAFYRLCGRYQLLFRGDTMLVLFRESFDAKHTNFFKKVGIAREDIDQIETRLKQIMGLAIDIVPQLD